MVQIALVYANNRAWFNLRGYVQRTNSAQKLDSSATNLVTSSPDNGWVSVQLLCKTVTPLSANASRNHANNRVCVPCREMKSIKTTIIACVCRAVK
jgi:hypothetical protein